MDSDVGWNLCRTTSVRAAIPVWELEICYGSVSRVSWFQSLQIQWQPKDSMPNLWFILISITTPNVATRKKKPIFKKAKMLIKKNWSKVSKITQFSKVSPFHTIFQFIKHHKHKKNSLVFHRGAFYFHVYKISIRSCGISRTKSPVKYQLVGHLSLQKYKTTSEHRWKLW